MKRMIDHTALDAQREIFRPPSNGPSRAGRAALAAMGHVTTFAAPVRHGCILWKLDLVDMLVRGHA